MRVVARQYIYEAPDLFSAGAVGEPGARAFYLQAADGAARTSVALEKVQVAALAERLVELLVAMHGVEPAADGEDPAQSASDEPPAAHPTAHAFRVGAMTLAWDAEREEVVIQVRPAVDDEVTEDGTDADLLHVRLRPDRAMAFARRASALVAAGRPSCPFCGEPIEPTGHFCARGRAHLN
jgi:uncharacterized repeat protein (TIGR03847 family)